MVKVRFAPSPTGHLHVGNAKVALLNYLFVKKEGGMFVLRIEDTDLERSHVSYETSILDDLTWLGIRWDEGPLRQTERFAIYHSYADDLLQTFPPDHVDDFILMKQEGTPSYNFAVVIDDMLMGITHVIRGADHLSNTPKQIMLFEALNGTPPQYGHLSLLVGNDDKPLSKRHGVTSIKDFREIGILPEALRNYLCTVGRSVSKEIMDVDELITTFSLTSLSRTNSFFDMEKLYWFNKEYLKLLPLDTLLAYLDLPDNYREKIAALRENASTLKELKEYLHIFDTADINEEAISYLSTITLPEGFIKKVAGFFAEHKNPSFENTVDSLMAGSGFKKKDFYMVLRILLTGRKSGPPLKEIFQLIQTEIIMKRIDNYLATSQKS